MQYSPLSINMNIFLYPNNFFKFVNNFLISNCEQKNCKLKQFSKSVNKFPTIDVVHLDRPRTARGRSLEGRRRSRQGVGLLLFFWPSPASTLTDKPPAMPTTCSMKRPVGKKNPLLALHRPSSFSAFGNTWLSLGQEVNLIRRWLRMILDVMNYYHDQLVMYIYDDELVLMKFINDCLLLYLQDD